MINKDKVSTFFDMEPLLEMKYINDYESLDDNEVYEYLNLVTNQSAKSKKNLKKKTYNYCESCENDNYIIEDYENGINVCRKCGNVLSYVMSSKPEWSNYNNTAQKSINRCSSKINELLPQSSLGTTIMASNRMPIKVEQGWGSMPYRERALWKALQDVKKRCLEANILQCIIDDVQILYKNMSECKYNDGKNKGKRRIIRGNNRKSLIAACVFYACKKKNHERSRAEIAEIFDLKNTDVTKGCKTFMDLLKSTKIVYNIKNSTMNHLIGRHCRKLKIHKIYIEQAIKILNNVKELDMETEHTHTPLSLASGIILLVTDINKLPITKKIIAKEFKVSEVTIAKVYKKLKEYKRILTSNKRTQKILQLKKQKILQLKKQKMLQLKKQKMLPMKKNRVKKKQS